MRTIEFVVFGDPVPQGSKRAFVVKNRAVVVDDNKARLKTWRSDVVSAASSKMNGDGPIDGPVRLTVFFYVREPKRPKNALPIAKPDVDKLQRSLLDALVTAGVIRDDAQITTITARKRYAEDGVPRTSVHLSEDG